MDRLYRIAHSRRMTGFSLIELLVVVAIIGLLAAIAYPSYQGYVRESRRSDAFGALLTAANNQEKWFLDNGTYTGTLASVWDNAGGLSLEGFYDITVPTGNATTFTVRAIAPAAGAQAADTCPCITIDAENRRRSFANRACTGADVGCW